LTDILAIAVGAIDFIGAVVVGWAAVRSARLLVSRGHLHHARMVLSDGAVAALNFVVAGTILKTLALRTWNELGMFAAVLALRTVVKRVFSEELQRIPNAS
jgi:uncharacterized membrane protein